MYSTCLYPASFITLKYINVNHDGPTVSSDEHHGTPSTCQALFQPECYLRGGRVRLHRWLVVLTELEHCEAPVFFSIFPIAESIWGTHNGICGINYTKVAKDNEIVYLSPPTGARGSADTGLKWVTVVRGGNDFLGSASCTLPSQIKLLPNLVTKLIIRPCVLSLSKLNSPLRKTM